jgi:hypothetical protein
MHLGWVTSLPISWKIALERSVLFEMEANSDGLLSLRSPSDWAAAANPDDSNNAATNFPRAANGINPFFDFLVMVAVTA